MFSRLKKNFIKPKPRPQEKAMLIYDGFLSDDTIYHIKDMGRSYPHIIEVTGITKVFWDAFFEWAKESAGNLIVHHDIEQESCMGEQYFRSGTLYGVVGSGQADDHRFIFFCTKQEKENFIRDFSSMLTIEPEPFKTALTI